MRRILTRGADASDGRSGTLVCEVGGGARARSSSEFPHLPFVWLDTEDTSGEVFLLRASDFGAARPRRKSASDEDG